jgi:hypothetical protein
MKIKMELVEHLDEVVNEDYPFITNLILKNNTSHKCIVDNVHNKWIGCYTLDFYNAHTLTDINLTEIHNWYENGCNMPISFLFEKLNIKQYMSPLFKTFHFSKIQTIEGPVLMFNTKPTSIARHQIKLIK